MRAARGEPGSRRTRSASAAAKAGRIQSWRVGGSVQPEGRQAMRSTATPRARGSLPSARVHAGEVRASRTSPSATAERGTGTLSVCRPCTSTTASVFPPAVSVSGIGGRSSGARTCSSTAPSPRPTWGTTITLARSSRRLPPLLQR